MVMYGNQIAGAEVQEQQNEWQDYAFPPVGTAKFVLGMSCIAFMTKVWPLQVLLAQYHDMESCAKLGFLCVPCMFFVVATDCGCATANFLCTLSVHAQEELRCCHFAFFHILSKLFFKH